MFVFVFCCVQNVGRCTWSFNFVFPLPPLQIDNLPSVPRHAIHDSTRCVRIDYKVWQVLLHFLCYHSVTESCQCTSTEVSGTNIHYYMRVSGVMSCIFGFREQQSVNCFVNNVTLRARSPPGRASASETFLYDFFCLSFKSKAAAGPDHRSPDSPQPDLDSVTRC